MACKTRQKPIPVFWYRFWRQFLVSVSWHNDCHGVEQHIIDASISTHQRPVYSDTTQLNSTDLLRADWLYTATGLVALPIVGDS